MNSVPILANRMEMWPIARLYPYEKNARRHSDAQIAQIAASMLEFGVNSPLLISAEGMVIAGHGRLQAAKKIGLEKLPVVVLDHLTPLQRRAYILADNKIAEGAGWDTDLLASELRALEEADLNLEMLGFSEKELEAFLPDWPETHPEDIDQRDENPQQEEIPSPPAHPVTLPGDIWILDSHKVICGDARNPAVVAKLMNDEAAALCFTSPPYGQQRGYATEIGNWDALMQGVFSCLPLRKNGQLLVNLGLIHRKNEVIPYWDDWLAWMRGQGWRHFGWYVWDQGAGLPGDWAGRFGPSFEFVFHFNRIARRPNKIIPCKYAGKDEQDRKSVV